MATMKLTCPECATAVPAEHINIQDHVAVCPNCNTVFRFELPEEKMKRRKVKQPQQMELRDGNILQMAFRTNFRLDQNENFIGASIVAGMFTLLTGIMGFEYLVEGSVPFIVPLIFLSFVLGGLYAMALIAYNKTHIEMSDDMIRVTRQPVPGSQVHTVDLHGIVAIKTEETRISKKEAYDTPRYEVWAETTDGRKRQIVTDLTEEYAYFVTQQLQQRLHETMQVDENYAADASRLTYAEVIDDDDNMYGEMATAQRNSNHSS
ncbi:MAG: hypothetical protein ACPG7F_12030 [Aggregatilineales bacterium]